MKSHAPRLIVLSATLLAIPALPRSAPAAQPEDASRWSNLKTIAPGTEICITTRDGRFVRRTMVAGNDTNLVTLDMTRIRPGRDSELALSAVENAPDAVAGTVNWQAPHLTIQGGVIREDGKQPIDLRAALDTFTAQEVALVVTASRPGSKFATTAATLAGFLVGIMSAVAVGMENRCQPHCGGVEAMTLGVGVGMPVGAGLTAWYMTRRPERVVYRAPAAAPQPPIDEATWERVRRGLPPSFSGIK